MNCVALASPVRAFADGSSPSAAQLVQQATSAISTAEQAGLRPVHLHARSVAADNDFTDTTDDTPPRARRAGPAARHLAGIADAGPRYLRTAPARTGSSRRKRQYQGQYR